MLIIIAFISLLSTNSDKAGRQCFDSLRSFHVIEMSLHSQSSKTAVGWPSSEEHIDITQKLSEIHSAVFDVLVYESNPADEKFISLKRHDKEMIEKLSLDMNRFAPKSAAKALSRLQKDCSKLVE